MARQMEMDLPEEIGPLCQAFLRGLKDALDAKLHGVYLYGAAAFPDSASIRDIDFHAILKTTLTPRAKSEPEIEDALRSELQYVGNHLSDYKVTPRLVGTPGFEPGTSCAPCKHAARLRHVPRCFYSTTLHVR